MSEQPLRIAIVGGGIGGLTLAVALSKSPKQFVVDIYEAKLTFNELGAGVGLLPRVWEALRSLGLEEQLRERTGTYPGGGKFQFRKSDQKEGFVFGSSVAEAHTIHRADLHNVLIQNIPSNYGKHFSKRLVSYAYTDSGPVVLSFEDGSTADCDLLVGADGVRSSVRKQLYQNLTSNAEKEGKPQAEIDQLCRQGLAYWTGNKVYRSLIVMEDLVKINPNHPSLSMATQYIGKNKARNGIHFLRIDTYTLWNQFMLTYPVSQGKLLNVVVAAFQHDKIGTEQTGPWVADAENKELVDHFVTWDSEVQLIAQLMGRSLRWLIYAVTIPTFSSGHVALLGDAAHSMEPFQAAGAGQAVEDALVLTSLLSLEETTRATLALALKVYDEIRRPIAQEVQRRSREAGKVGSLNGEDLADVPAEASGMGLIPFEKLQALDRKLNEMARWTWTSNSIEDKARAVEVFQKYIGDSNASAIQTL